MTLGCVIKTWHINKDICVQIKHNTYTGSRYVMLNGEIDRTTSGTSSIYSLRGTGSDVFRLSLDRDVNIIVRVALISNFGFSYRCEFNGSILKEANDIIGEEMKETYESTVNSTELIPPLNKGDQGLVLYHVETTRSTDGRVSRRTRRFKEFFDLSDDIYAAFAGNHLVNDLPKLPSRGIKYLSDHLDPLFVETRRIQLHTYLRALEKIPRVSKLPQYLSFIGMGKKDTPDSPTHAMGSSITDVTLRPGDFSEFSFEFVDEHLGITLKNTTSKIGSAVVEGFNQLSNGDIGSAEKGGIVGIGDVVSRVNGIDVSKSSYEEVISLIKNQRRPCTIHFLRKRGSNPPKLRLSDPTPVSKEAITSTSKDTKTSVNQNLFDSEEGLFS